MHYSPPYRAQILSLLLTPSPLYYLLLLSLLLTTPLLTTYPFPPYYLKAKLSHIVFLAFALQSLSFWHAFSELLEIVCNRLK